MIRDSQRQRVYDAEKILWPRRRPETAIFANIEVARACAQQITGSATFRRWFPETPESVTLLEGRSCYQQMFRIRLAPYGFNNPCLLHELCHLVLFHRYFGKRKPADFSNHGWEFASTFLRMVGRWMGKSAERTLRAEFKRLKVRTRPRRTRELTDEQRQVLRERFQERVAATRRRP